MAHHLLLPAGATVMALALACPAWASPTLAAKGGCAVCHAADKKGVGPSWKEIAGRYKGQADAPAKLAQAVRKGSKGAWGAVPMAPTGADKLSDAELKDVVAWLLKTP